MSKISDELRKWCDLCGGIIDSSDKAELHALADRIDAEMLELPRDRDGVPIHVGDTVCLEDGRKAKVTRIGIGVYEDGIYTLVFGYNFSVRPEHVSHERPDSWERIADEIERYANDSRSEDEIDGMTASTLVDFTERIRKLAERDGE